MAAVKVKGDNREMEIKIESRVRKEQVKECTQVNM